MPQVRILELLPLLAAVATGVVPNDTAAAAHAEIRAANATKYRYSTVDGAHFHQERRDLSVGGNRPSLVLTEQGIVAIRLKRGEVRVSQPAQHHAAGNTR